MKCEELLHMLNDYVDGDIDPSICAEFEKHLKGCDACRVVVDSIHKTITFYKDNSVYELPIAFRRRLHSELRRRWKERRG